MKKHSRYTRPQLLLGSLAFICLVFFAVSSLAGEQGGAIPDAELSVHGELRTGQPVMAFFDLKGYTIHKGSYASVNVRFVRKPDGIAPKVKIGYPETVLYFNTPGAYRISFILNEVSKPSCGGVKAKLLLEKTIDLEIAE